MKRLEFLGANGVGKTTTMRFLLQHGEGVLMDQHAGCSSVAKASLDRLPARKARVRRAEFMLKSRRKRRSRQLRDQSVRERLERDPGEMQAFVDHALKLISSSDLGVNDKRSETAGFFDALYDALYLDSSRLPCIALCDESITLKTLMVAMLARSDKDALRLFELMPLPDAVVLMRAEGAEIFERLAQRERGKAYSHIHYLRSYEKPTVVERLVQIDALAGEGGEILAARGCPVVSLDVDRQDLHEQTRMLQPVLRQLAE